MPDVQTERVLVVPTELFHRLGYFQGFCGEVDRYLDELFSPRHTSYRPRGEVEVDPSFKQLIPYVKKWKRWIFTGKEQKYARMKILKKS